jgi:hypothetical protein
MNVIKDIHLIIYRIRQKGLEVFLVNQDLESDDWHLPSVAQNDDSSQFSTPDQAIELESVAHDGASKEAFAVEGDWHDIPSLKSLIKQDVKFVAGKVFEELEKHGTYFAVKDGIKKVLPKEQYAFIKELKDIITEKNSVQDL